MKLDSYPFLVNVNLINFEEKRVLVRMDQADTTRGKKVIVSDEPRLKMMVPKNPKLVEWKVNRSSRPTPRVKVTSALLLEKCARQ
jgi:hypothetical protein